MRQGSAEQQRRELETAIASLPPELTVSAVPASLATHKRSGAFVSRLGRLTCLDAGATTEGRSRPAGVVPLIRDRPRGLRFPMGAAVRSIDDRGRIKVSWSENGRFCATEVLGWRPGAIQMRIIDGWAVATQPAHFIGSVPPRGSSHANFTAGSGGERLLLRDAHRHALHVSGSVLVAPLPRIGGLVIASIDVCLSAEAPPDHVIDAITDVDSIPVIGIETDGDHA